MDSPHKGLAAQKLFPHPTVLMLHVSLQFQSPMMIVAALRSGQPTLWRSTEFCFLTATLIVIIGGEAKPSWDFRSPRVSPMHTSSMVTYKLQSVLSIPQVWSHRNFRQSYAYPKYGHIETSVSPIHTSSMVTYKLQSVLSIPQVWSHRNFRQSYAYPKYGHVQTSVSPIHTPSMVTYKLPSVLSISPIHTPSMVTYKLSSVPSIPQVWSIYKLPSVLSIPQVWSHTNFRQSYAYPMYGHIQTSVSPMHTPSIVT